MKSVTKTIITLALMPCLYFFPLTIVQANTVNTKVTAQQNDLKQLNQLWLAYQDQILVMDKALNTLKNQADEVQKNATISLYIKKIDQTKTAINRLILTQNNAQLLRQQMIEHATKYQNVYRLATATQPNPHQLNMVQRLTAQTDVLYQKMKATAQVLYS